MLLIDKIYVHHNSKQTNEIACFYSGRLNAKIISQKRFQSSKTEKKCSRKKMQLTPFDLRFEEVTLIEKLCD